MRMVLNRFSYGPTETEGILVCPPLAPLYTLEQPWVADERSPAGVGYQSCVPDGLYALIPHVRGNGRRTYCLVNEALRVYYEKPEGYGRYKCLIHKGNVVSDTQGCVLPGEKRGILSGERAVLSSTRAMDALIEVLGFEEGHELLIRPALGAQYKEGITND